MNYIRKSESRGGVNFGWLDSKHSFSFGSYYDPKHMGFSVLRVINDDSVIGGAGFDTHGHRDMEIISYVLEGAIEHKDSMGNQFILPAGEVQRMSAGTGITHSEFNHSKSDSLRFLQIWIQPQQMGIKPSYQQANIEQQSELTALVTPDGRDGSLSINQDASLYRLELNASQEFALSNHQRAGYLHIVSGSVKMGNGDYLAAGDGLGVTSNRHDQLIAGIDSVKALWFDLPKMN